MPCSSISRPSSQRTSPLRWKVKLGKQAADLCTSSLTQFLVDAYFDEGVWRRYVSDLCAIYRQRRDAMLDALAEYGVTHIDMMLRPEKLWRIIHGGAA